MKYLFALIVGLLILQGCATVARYDKKYAEKLEQWHQANPDVPLTPEVEDRLKNEAEAEVAQEVAAERAAAAAKVAEVAGHAATGNLVAAGIGLLALFGIGVGAYKKARGV